MWTDEMLQRVNDRWEENKALYPGGYAVFYGPIFKQPILMLIGDNPGGGKASFEGKDFLALERERWSLPEMEYLKYQAESNYPLAVKTVHLFDDAGHLDLLRASVKTNACFFRSRKSSEVRKDDWAWCMDVLHDIIQHIQPKVLVCESIGILDWVLKCLYSIEERQQQNVYRRRSRKYVSYICNKKEWPSLVIGITHLTGSRPSNEDIEEIARLLQKDLNQLLPA